ncbi:MAG: hypothetical protein R2861_07005 [Desulfobacterales bacterium]
MGSGRKNFSCTWPEQINLDGLNPSNLSVNVDLSKYGPWNPVLVYTSDNVRLPKGVRLLETYPAKPGIDPCGH